MVCIISSCVPTIFTSNADFCLWAPSEPNSVVADTEGQMVAWCTKPGRGTRVIPESALQGVQFMKTPNYVQVIGFIQQELINLASGDFGGEMDPHGADLRGNPMGGLIYSEAFGGGWKQVNEWNKCVCFLFSGQNAFLNIINHSFMGGNAFCIKACDPSKPDDEKYCEHRLDRIGCAYNSPNNAQNGTFESCEGENQEFPGVYTLNGQVMTYSQPPESLGPITSMPYTARIPASSNCVTYTSSAIYTGLPSPSIQLNAAPTSAPSSGTATRSGSGTASGSRTGSAQNVQNTSNDATSLAISGISFLGVVFSLIFLA
jgi:hypothetical protein